MIIDSHQHFWKYNAKNHAWINDEMSAIRRDFLPKDLKPIYDAYGIDGCVAVQVDQNEEENEFLLGLGRQHSFIKGIVGWVDFRATNISERLSFYSSIKLIKGFRHIVQGEPDKRFLMGEFFCRGIAGLRQYNFTYDILVYAHQLDQVEEFVKRFPNQPFIIDHLAKPAIKERSINDWRQRMQRIARHENVWCKLSGMVTEADWKKWTFDDLQPYMDAVLAAFGPKRIVFGSDWPVCLVAASYEQQLNVVQQFISRLSPAEQKEILGENAIRFYHL
jgi:L-fuconolactonase